MIMNKSKFFRISLNGLVISIGKLFLFYKTLTDGGWIVGAPIDTHSVLYIKATTTAFASIIIFQMINAFNAKTQVTSIFSREFFQNKFLIVAVAFSTITVVSLSHLPIYSKILHTTPLSLIEWSWILGVALSILVVEETRKFIARRTGTSSPA